MLEDKQRVSVVRDDASSRFDRKTSNFKSEKARAAKRKAVKRANNFKSDDWYEKAALSMAISAKS